MPGRRPCCASIAGLLTPREGTLAVDGVSWLDTERGLDLPPERRRVGYLFQEYALFPHLDVAQNVRFGALDRTLADAMLDRFGIAPPARARARASSRAASASGSVSRGRSLATRTCCCSTSRSRRSTRTRKSSVRLELHQHLRELDLPAIVVTHDFDDAAALADRIGVIVDGTLLQSGTAAELIGAPADAFVASFTGANLIPGNARPGPDGLTEVVLDGGGSMYSADEGEGRVGLAVYPWEVALARDRARRLGRQPPPRRGALARRRSATASASASAR